VDGKKVSFICSRSSETKKESNTSPFEAYTLYLSIKRHFTSTYNAFQYNFKINASAKAFDDRKDRFFFQKLAKHEDPKGLLVACMLDNPKAWIREIAYSERCAELYAAHTKKLQALTHLFKQDLKKIGNPFTSVDSSQGEHPYIMTLYMTGDIMFETLVIVTMLMENLDRLDRMMDGDPVWEEMSFKIRKYAPFLSPSYDPIKYKKIIAVHTQDLLGG
jgi:hypothetical protein